MTLPPEIAAWIDEAVPAGTDTPCGHYTATSGTTCDQVPTRQYIQGRRCYHHAPDRQKGQDTR